MEERRDRLGDLVSQLQSRAITRRQFMKRAVLLGLSLPAIGAVLVV